ncbi:heparinase II/III-family protein, partial [bacterium]|nr:heparinase II/III-family protein [bacterium]
MPCKSWDETPDVEVNELALGFIPRFDSNTFLTLLSSIQQGAEANGSVIQDAHEIRNGRFTFFEYHKKQINFPPNWRMNYFTGECAPADVHWSQIHDFGYGDIKAVWELSRFSWAYTLARAYARTNDSQWAECFWTLFEDWLNHNPPHCGVQWKCGQETAFRLMAVCFAVRVMRDDPSSNEKRMKRWRKFVWVSAERIAGNIDYALSQSNNHGISECIGLMTAVRLLSDSVFAERWEAYALRALQQQVVSLIYEDGSFSQHSTVYHRVMLHTLVWFAAMELSCGNKIPHVVHAAGKRATKFLFQMVDLQTGTAPLTGHNDGSNIMPLADCRYHDFRPALQMAAWFFCPELLLPKGPWDEALLWLAGEPALHAAREQNFCGQSFYGQDGGHAMLHQPNSRLYIHAPKRFKHRPSQADLLHVDVWHRGVPITQDAGTFSYNTSGPFSQSMMNTGVHNTIEIDGQSQMEKANRFLFLPWANCEMLHSSDREFYAAHNGYQKRGLRHTRKVQANQNEGWTITDEIHNSNREQTYHCRLHWLLADRPYEVDLDSGML